MTKWFYVSYSHNKGFGAICIFIMDYKYFSVSEVNKWIQKFFPSDMQIVIINWMEITEAAYKEWNERKT